jgi:prophage regulatory protein
MLDDIIRKKDLPRHVGLRSTAIDAAIERGDFPPPIPLGPRAVGWLGSELAAWQQARVAKRDALVKSIKAAAEK